MDKHSVYCKNVCLLNVPADRINTKLNNQLLDGEDRLEVHAERGTRRRNVDRDSRLGQVKCVVLSKSNESYGRMKILQ